MTDINPAIAALERIKRHAEDALRETKSARTQGDVPRSIQRVIDGLSTFIALSGVGDITEVQIKHMTNRFLGWRLPEDFRPDCGIQFDADAAKKLNPRNHRYEPIGTNLLTATQAEAMVRYMLEGI